MKRVGTDELNIVGSICVMVGWIDGWTRLRVEIGMMNLAWDGKRR